jgi:putative membrane protein
MTMWGYGPGSGYGMMGGWGYGGYGGFGWGLLHIVISVAVIVCVVFFVVWALRTITGVGPHHGSRRSAGLEVLEERYARGEINRDEYLQKKRDILA